MNEDTKPILSDDDEKFFENYKNCCGGDGDREDLAEYIAADWQCEYHVPMLDAYLLWGNAMAYAKFKYKAKKRAKAKAK